MNVYRIAKKQHSDLMGIGGLYSWGRWHKKGNRIIYTSETRSLAAWEKFVHISSLSLIPDDLVMIKIEIPVNRIKVLTGQELKKGWKAFPYIKQTLEIGTSFLQEPDNLILKVPSAVIDNEFNYLINPGSTHITECNIQEVKEFNFDKRIFRL